MEKWKWLWNGKSSEGSPGGEGESNGSSLSSHSERYSDEQEESPELEVTSKATLTDEEMEETIKNLTAKLSAALVNVSAKEDLVKQHARVAEEAVAGWEKAENVAAAMKQQLDVAVQQNLSLEVRASHLEGALRECVKQLRQARDEEKSHDWESQKAELEKQIQYLKDKAETAAAVDPDILLMVENLEKENSSLRQEVMSRCKDLEVIIVERDLSNTAAETASKLQLESIKKVTKLEAECRMLQSLVRKSSPLSNQKSLVSSSCAESVTDSYLESLGTQRNGCEPRRCGDLLQAMPKNLTACSVEIYMMDDFLEMERLAGLHETGNNSCYASETASRECVSDNNAFKEELDSMTQQVAELEEKMRKLEAEKLELESALNESVDSLMVAQKRAAEAEFGLEELRKELAAVNETKGLMEFQLVDMEAEARTMSSTIDSLMAEIEDERQESSEVAAKCEELKKELRKFQENQLECNNKSNAETKIKQEDLAVAADKLAECQKTIASLGRQLQSLATLEDFLIDTSNIPIPEPPSGGGDMVMGSLTNDERFAPKYDLGQLRLSMESYSNSNGGSRNLVDLSPSLTMSALSSSSNHSPAPAGAKSWSSFGRIFSRSKSVVELESSPAG